MDLMRIILDSEDNGTILEENTENTKDTQPKPTGASFSSAGVYNRELNCHLRMNYAFPWYEFQVASHLLFERSIHYMPRSSQV